MSNRILTKARFKVWLKKKRPRTPVGISDQCTTCPIAKFLGQTTGKEYEVDDIDCFLVHCQGWTERKMVLPNWAQRFIIKVDDEDTKYVSAKRALELLKAVG